MHALSREETRAIDQAGIDEFGIPGVVLMENAGRGAADLAERIAAPGAGPAAVLVGRGNNGGDGFVVARHLHNRGYDVRILAIGDRRRLLEAAGDAATMGRIVDAMGLPITFAPDDDAIHLAMPEALSGAGVVIDGLLGTGLAGEVRGPMRLALELVAGARPPLLALDLPSGLDANTGAVLGVALRATITATFGRPKLGLLVGEGPAHAGRIDVVDIGVPRELYAGAGTEVPDETPPA